MARMKPLTIQLTIILSHHGKDPAKIDELKLIEEAEFMALQAWNCPDLFILPRRGPRRVTRANRVPKGQDAA
ncbi:MAG TPA: hypothetical protein VMM76_05865 [Pirellulaceae bacterium]|nr:hypothetical protein [Pirellulaceae bacterium]